MSAARKLRLADLGVTQLGPGVTRQRVTGERLELIRYHYAPGSTFATHQHEAEQLTIVLSGKLVFAFADEEVGLEPGDALLIPGNLPHGAFVPADAPDTETYNLFSPVRDTLPSA